MNSRRTGRKPRTIDDGLVIAGQEACGIAELADSHGFLEQRVEERTAELAQSAQRLEKEVIERKRAEERLTILVRELSQ